MTRNSRNATYSGGTIDSTETVFTAAEFINHIVRVQTDGGRFAVVSANACSSDLEPIDFNEKYSAISKDPRDPGKNNWRPRRTPVCATGSTATTATTPGNPPI